MALNKDRLRICRVNKEREKKIARLTKNDDFLALRLINTKEITYNDSQNYREIMDIKKRLEIEKYRIKNPHWQLHIAGFELD